MCRKLISSILLMAIVMNTILAIPIISFAEEKEVVRVTASDSAYFGKITYEDNKFISTVNSTRTEIPNDKVVQVLLNYIARDIDGINKVENLIESNNIDWTPVKSSLVKQMQYSDYFNQRVINGKELEVEDLLIQNVDNTLLAALAVFKCDHDSSLGTEHLKKYNNKEALTVFNWFTSTEQEPFSKSKNTDSQFVKVIKVLEERKKSSTYRDINSLVHQGLGSTIVWAQFILKDIKECTQDEMLTSLTIISEEGKTLNKLDPIYAKLSGYYNTIIKSYQPTSMEFQMFHARALSILNRRGVDAELRDYFTNEFGLDTQAFSYPTSSTNIQEDIVEAAIQSIVSDYNTVLENVNEKYRGDADITRIATLVARIKLSMYMMNSDYAANEEIDKILKFSTSEQYTTPWLIGTLTFKPRTPKNSIINQIRMSSSRDYYTVFNESVNELSLVYKFILENRDSLENISNGDVVSTGAMLRTAKMLYYYKEAVEIVRRFSELDTSKVVKFWYEDKYINGKSLEEIYQTVVQYELLEKEALSFEVNVEQPLAYLMNSETGDISKYLREGYALSAHYLPLETNISELHAYGDLASREFYEEFLPLYGDIRKALLFVNKSGSAQQYYNSGNTNNAPQRVLTLRQFLNNSDDMVVYVQDKVYNVDEQLANQVMLLKKLDEVNTTLSNIAESVNDLPEDIKEIISNSQDEFIGKVKTGAINAGTSLVSKFFSIVTIGVSDTVVETIGTGVDFVTDVIKGGDKESRAAAEEARKQIIEEYTKIVADKSIKSMNDLNPSLAIESACNPEFRKALKDKIKDEEVDSPEAKKYAKLYAESILIDKSILSTSDIRNALTTYQTNSQRSLAINSAMYRDVILRERLRPFLNKPLFTASSSVFRNNNISDEGMLMYINYLTLSNLRDIKKIDYRVSIDLDSPLYVDVFGNIVTESGYVVIPAASNATIMNSWNPFTVGFLKNYGRLTKASTDAAFLQQGVAASIFEADDDGTTFRLASNSESGVINFEHLSAANKDLQRRTYQLALSHIQEDGVNTDYMMAQLVKSAQGADLSSIDRSREGLDIATGVSRTGVAQANRLEDVSEALSSDNFNPLIRTPNLAFSQNTEIVFLVLFRLTMLIVLVLIIAQIFVMGMTSKFSLMGLGKILGSVLLTILIIFTVPFVNELSQYEVNKQLLQDEVLNIAMFNLEKKERGVEIGMKGLSAYESNTKLYLKVEEIRIPWGDFITEVVYTPVTDTLSNINERYAEEQYPVHNMEGFSTINDTIYIDVDKMFESTTILMNEDFGRLYQYIEKDVPASFYTPYYAFLDALISDVNSYNAKNKMFNYTTATYGGGKLMTQGAIKDYLTSEDFMVTKKDLLHVNEIYSPAFTEIYSTDTEAEIPEGALELAENLIFDDLTKEAIHKSYWFNDRLLNYNTGEAVADVAKRTEILDKVLRDYVAENVTLLGRMSDSTILKTLALRMAIEYNQVFNVPPASSLEIFRVDQEELIRTSIFNKKTLAETSPLSYARSVLTTGGELSVYAGVILEFVLFVSGWVRRGASVAIFVLFYFSIFVMRLMLRKEGANIKHYSLLTSILFGLNIGYALVLKVSLKLATSDMSVFVALLVLILINLAYSLLFINIVAIAAKNWRNLGYERYRESAVNVIDKTRNVSERLAKSLEKDKDNIGIQEYKRLTKKQKDKTYSNEGDDM